MRLSYEDVGFEEAYNYHVGFFSRKALVLLDGRDNN